MNKFVATIFVAVFSSFEYNLGDDESDLFQSNDLDCWYKPSCNLSPSSNTSLIPFVAGCKCDVDCLEYDDCCKDSKYFRESRLRPGKEFNCHPKLEVQMVASCPESYRDSSVARNCSFELPINDISFVVPVTVKKTRTTYANKYCASCHNETDYEPWDLTVDFVRVTSSFFENDYSDSDSDSDSDSESARVEKRVDREDGRRSAKAAPKPNSTAESDENAARRPIRVEDLFASVRFYSARESFLAAFEGQTFVCAFDSKMPAEMAAFVRRCLPNLIAECPDDGQQNELCHSYTEIVYDRYNSLSFRNKDCAECNSVPPDDASYCPQTLISAEPARAYVISSRNKARNRRLCANPILPEYFCPAA